MDQNSTVAELKKLYRLENKSVELESEEKYVQKHLARIWKECSGGWDRTVVEKYIKSLKQSI